MQRQCVAEIKCLDDSQFVTGASNPSLINSLSIDSNLTGVFARKINFLVECHLNGRLSKEHWHFLCQSSRNELWCIYLSNVNLSIRVLAGCGKECHSC